MKRAMNMKKAEIVDMVKINDKVKVKAKSTIKDLEKVATTEILHPQGFTVDSEITDTFKTYIESLESERLDGLKIKIKKNGGYVGKDGRKTIVELYDCTEYDDRIHVYGSTEFIDELVKNKTLKGFRTDNAKWSLESRFEIAFESWLDFIETIITADTDADTADTADTAEADTDADTAEADTAEADTDADK